MSNLDYKVYDDVLTKNQSTEILKVLQSPKFPWFLSAGRTYEEKDGNVVASFRTATIEDMESAKKKHKNIKEYLQFVHTFYASEKTPGDLIDTKINSSYVKLSNDIINAFMHKVGLETVNILRCKANFQTQHANNDSSFYNTPHKDFDIPHKVLLYYVNDSDGDTILFDKDEKEYARITPKQGRMLYFNGKTLHAGNHPFKSECRIVINYDLAEKSISPIVDK